MKMSEVQERTTVCGGCGKSLPVDFTGRCPDCGCLAMNRKVICRDQIGFRDILGWKSQREFIQKNLPLFYLSIALTIVSPIIGYFEIGLIGIAVGFLLGGISYVAGLYAVTKIREIPEGNST
jgi:predicted RNA-binding Zn-ribbon protein involved in translation (DUF1610 family)